MSQYPLVFGVKLRLTKVNSCGLPLAGPANRIVTDGYVTANFTPQMKDAADLDQNNAEGLICVTERTAPQRKRWQLALELCNVDTGVISLLTAWEQLLDYADNPNGFQDSMSVESELGVAIEIWTGGKAATDCPPQVNDDIFSNPGTGKNYGYMLAFGTEFQLGNVNVGAQVSTLTLTGITFPGPQWGLGPYNVAAIDANGTPGRLLTPTNDDSQLLMFRTPVPPPDNTPAGTPAPLEISSIFTGTTYYFGGPSNASAATVAPEQPAGTTDALTITGSPTGGDVVIEITSDNFPQTDTVTIAYNSTAAEAAAAIIAADEENFNETNVWVTGGPLPATPLSVNFSDPTITATVVTPVGLTGGTDPTATV
jgi:hypothetical protein